LCHSFVVSFIHSFIYSSIHPLNTPQVDTYGTQQPIALLFTLMGRSTVYDREKDLNLKQLRDLQYIGAMGPPGGGRNPVDPRFVALFNVFNLTPPTDQVLQNIYSSIVVARYAPFNDGVKAAVAKITAATLKLYAVIIEKMPPTPSKFHYIFNLRDLSRVYEGLCNVTTDVVATNKDFVRLWRHECDRVFFDRLTTNEDQAVYTKELTAVCKEAFSDCVGDVMKEPCLFGDFEHSIGACCVLRAAR
jgi:dynein heavy chain